MKIRSVLLGSLAAVGLSTAGFAADLGVITSLDICDELGLSGLTISSDDNCLAITGGVSFEYKIGDYADGSFPGPFFWAAFNRVGWNNDGDVDVPDADGGADSGLDIDVWLKFVATADSDFGPATATIKLLAEDWNGTGDMPVLIDEAWVGIGDTTMLMAGKKGSIFNDGDDAPLNYLGLYNSSNVDAGVGFQTEVDTGGAVIQVVSNLGNGVSIGGGIEDLNGSGFLTAVGVLAYAGDGITAHVSSAYDTDTADWNIHAGFTGAWDPIKVVGAVAADSGGWWNALGSVSATFDMFTLAASAEATSANEWGAGASLSAAVSDGVTLNIGGRYFDDVSDIYQLEAGVSAAVTESITLTAAIGTEARTAGGIIPTDEQYFYGKGGLAWAPGGGFTSSIEGYVNSYGAYKATFKAAKDIK